MRLQYLPTIRHKYFDTLAHTVRLDLHLLTHRVGRGALLQRRQRDFHDVAAPGRDAGGAQRGRASSGSARSGIALAKAWYLRLGVAEHILPDGGRHGRADHPAVLPRALRQGERFIPYGAEVGKVASAEVLANWASSAGATSCT